MIYIYNKKISLTMDYDNNKTTIQSNNGQSASPFKLEINMDSLSRVPNYQEQNHCLNREKIETSRDVAIKAPETGTENAAPASGDGAGDIAVSCAEEATAKRRTARTRNWMVMLI